MIWFLLVHEFLDLPVFASRRKKRNNRLGQIALFPYRGSCTIVPDNESRICSLGGIRAMDGCRRLLFKILFYQMEWSLLGHRPTLTPFDNHVTLQLGRTQHNCRYNVLRRMFSIATNDLSVSNWDGSHSVEARKPVFLLFQPS